MAIGASVPARLLAERYLVWALVHCLLPRMSPRRPSSMLRRPYTILRPMRTHHIATHRRRRPTTHRIDYPAGLVRYPLHVAILSSLCLGIATTGCSIQHRPKMQYSGPLTSTSASCPKTQGTIVIQQGQVVFSPDEGTWTLEGEADSSGLIARHSRPSFDHKTFATELKATSTELKVVGTYTTPACTYAVNLTRLN